MINILSIDEIIRRYSRHVKKAELLNTTDNEHYRERKSVITYLKLLKSYIRPGYALKVYVNADTMTNSCNNILFSSINKALGIELTEWQKVYIMTGCKLQEGQATAQALKQLLNNTARPMDLTGRAVGYYCADIAVTDEALEGYSRLVADMYDRLEAAGIPVRRILRNEQEYEEYISGTDIKDPEGAWINAMAIHNGIYEREEYGNR